ncbi:SMI1/KNR4 family protein [Clostridium estertheticum]|uniref:SMI1/KNR4 family protein n=1 Tax=Clostridium estertheticum TaxID=238834 RepID=UPI001CF5A974|nr:SMI1/KNR4 family protein [Clostridium estertheticum]MCB2362395.1 SMI1/KNR4 family protein [Clostridium estertheticum]
MENIKELRKRYIKLYPDDGINKVDLDKIEVNLGVELPKDFCEIALFYGGELLSGIDTFSFSCDKTNTNIIAETIRIRSAIGLPSRFIVLGEPPESLIVMDTENTPSIIWCDAMDVSRLDDNSFISKTDKWNTYLEFFIELLEEEEEQME